MQIHALWELMTVCGCQIVLIAFNVVLLGLSIGNWKKRSGGRKSGSSPAPVLNANDVKEKAAGKRVISAKAVAAAPLSPQAVRTSYR